MPNAFHGPLKLNTRLALAQLGLKAAWLYHNEKHISTVSDLRASWLFFSPLLMEKYLDRLGCDM